MTTSVVIDEIRRRLGDIEGILGDSFPSYSDDYLLEVLAGAIRALEAKAIFTTSYSISGSTISPEPSLLDGLILSAWAVNDLLVGDIIEKIRSGGLGVRFRSGQDEISTVEAARKVTDAQKLAYKEYRELVSAKLADNSNASVRLQ